MSILAWFLSNVSYGRGNSEGKGFGLGDESGDFSRGSRGKNAGGYQI
jgi:hypothetical protein